MDHLLANYASKQSESSDSDENKSEQIGVGGGAGNGSFEGNLSHLKQQLGVEAVPDVDDRCQKIMEQLGAGS